ncbi:MAG: hypothetical protein P8126_08695, partial [Gammaproteobacteria bacterium]
MNDCRGIKARAPFPAIPRAGFSVSKKAEVTMTDQLSIDPSILRKIPLFSSLSNQELQQILKAPENGIEEYGMKKTIDKESEIGDCMYVVLD